MSLKLGTNDIPSLSPGAIRLGANSLDRVYDGTKLVWERGFNYTDQFNNLTGFTQTSTGSGVGITSGFARWAGGTDGSAILLYNSQALTTNQLKLLKEILLPGLPDHVWGVEYTNYEANPTDTQQAMLIDEKLRQLLRTMLNLPEFFLS